MTKAPSWTQLHAQVHTVIRQRQLFRPQQSILVAVSGGQDSLCLLKILGDLQQKWSWRLGVAHCDHGWSSDLGLADHVANIVGAWDLPFYLQIAPPLKETEAEARTWRYQALVETAEQAGFDTIVTGHTRSDRAETFLFNLLRGTGADGLSALTWKRTLTSEIQLVRPLLEVSRSTTGQFCQEFNLPVWQDEANQNLRYARNRIRSQLIPYLQEHFNPQVETALAQASELLRADVAHLEAEASQLLREAVCFTLGEESGSRRNCLNFLGLCSVSLALQRRVMRKFLGENMLKSPDFEQVEEMVRLINGSNRDRTSTLGKLAHSNQTVYGEVEGDWICLKTMP